MPATSTQVCSLELPIFDEHREAPPVTKLDAFEQAMNDLGDVSAEELSRYVEAKFGVVIPPPHVPLFRATMQQRMATARALSREAGSQ